MLGWIFLLGYLPASFGQGDYQWLVYFVRTWPVCIIFLRLSYQSKLVISNCRHFEYFTKKKKVLGLEENRWHTGNFCTKMSFLEFPRMKNEWEWANMTADLFINYPSLMTSRLIWSDLLYICMISFPQMNGTTHWNSLWQGHCRIINKGTYSWKALPNFHCLRSRGNKRRWREAWGNKEWEKQNDSTWKQFFIKLFDCGS